MTTPTDEELQAVVDAYREAGGIKTRAAAALGLPPQTFRNRLKMAEKRFGVVLGSLADGDIEPTKTEFRNLPAKGKVARYIFTSIQNNTLLHPGWINLLGYARYLDGLRNSSCELIVGTFTYSVDAYGRKTGHKSGLWYAPEIEEFIQNRRIQIAPALIWCGEMNILPTNRNPLTGMETYNGRASNIVPHAVVAMESVPSLKYEATKFNWTTGAATMRNYVQRRVGIIAEQRHCYGGLLAEVDHNGNWFVRQLHIDGNGQIMDIGPQGHKPVRVVDGAVVEDARVDSIVWGDIHAAEMPPWINQLAWGPGGMLDALKPKRQFMHDVFSMRSRSPHEENDFHARFAKHAKGQDNVQEEVELTASFLNMANRRDVQMIIVPSNHDRHLDRWLNEADSRRDTVNAQYFSVLQAAKLAMIRAGVKESILEMALRAAGLSDSIMFLRDDESYVICRDVDGGIECGLHGDRGANGGKGSTKGLTRLGRAVNKAHDHTAAIRDDVYSAGTCGEEFSYQHGPSAHSASHIVTFENGRRQIVTFWDGKYRL